MDPKSKEFKALKAEWDKKLAKSGFEDLEQPDGNLKVWDSFFFAARVKKSGPLNIQSHIEYYQMATKFLHEYPFKNLMDRQIWEMHTDGASAPKISTELKKTGIKIYKQTILAKLKVINTAMFKAYGIKYE